MTRELSQDTDKALEQIANGWGREPTTAHPACLCGGRARFNRVIYRPGWDGEIRVYRGSLQVQIVPCPVHPKAKR